jgi:hypothetical protein
MIDSTQNSDEIILLVSPDETASGEGQRGWDEDIRKRVSALVEVKVDPSVLERQMASFLSLVGRLFQQADQQMQSQSSLQPGIQLSEIELSVEIGAKGEVKLVAGGEVSGKGAIKLKFTRPGGR